MKSKRVEVGMPPVGAVDEKSMLAIYKNAFDAFGLKLSQNAKRFYSDIWNLGEDDVNKVYQEGLLDFALKYRIGMLSLIIPAIWVQLYTVAPFWEIEAG